jgi:ankyrin repeat protein
MALHLQDQLLQAIQTNDTSTVAQLLEDGADPNAGLLEGDFSALSIAVLNGAGDIVNLLLRHGCDCCMVEHISESPATPDPDPEVDI